MTNFLVGCLVGALLMAIPFLAASRVQRARSGRPGTARAIASAALRLRS